MPKNKICKCPIIKYADAQNITIKYANAQIK